MSFHVIQGSFPHGLPLHLIQPKHPAAVQPRMARPSQIGTTGGQHASTATALSPQQRAIQAHQQTLAAHQATRQGAVKQRTLVQPHLQRPQFAQPQAVPHPGQSHVSAAGDRAPAIQRHGNGSAFQLPPNLSNFNRGNGQPLPVQIQQKMESFFGTSFSDVRIHVGPQASSIGALAFTHGSNLYFAPGQYNPSTPHGQQLLGHELTHVM